MVRYATAQQLWSTWSVFCLCGGSSSSSSGGTRGIPCRRLSVGYCHHTGGLTLDSSLTFTAYISNIWRKSHFHVRAPCYIKNCLMEDDAKTVCSAVVNCNWLLQLSLPDFQRQHQQATTDTEYSCSCCFRCQPLSVPGKGRQTVFPGFGPSCDIVQPIYQGPFCHT